jgi:uncharacterized membrane protein
VSGRRPLRALGSFGTPLVYAVSALALGLLVPRIEARFLPGLAYTGTAPALALLSAIASGTMPLTGLVFSLAFVMVQFSSVAYSPRLVAWLVGSSVMHHSLGAFTGTFLYSLAAIAWVDRGGSGTVPLLTVAIAIAWLLVSVGFFVMLVERLQMLQIARVLAYAGDQGRAVIAAYQPLAAEAPDDGALPSVSQVLAHHGGPAVVQAVDLRRLAGLAEREGAVVAMAAAVGDTPVDGMSLLRVHGAKRPLSESALRRCVQLGEQRTFEQDPKYALRLIVDIAIKALSPAINDPTTAVQALDQIEDLLLRLGRVNLAAGRIRDAAGHVRVLLVMPSWDDIIALALDEIRFYGASSIQVTRRMRALLRNLLEHLPPERRPPLAHYLDRLNKGATRAFEDGEDRSDALGEDRQGLGLSRERPAT